MKPVDSKYLYSDTDWNYLTDEQIHSSGPLAYAGQFEANIHQETTTIRLTNVQWHRR